MQPRGAVWRDLGHLVGWLAIAIGLVGVILHLDSRFFHERTIKSLVYAAPFAAPLAYTGLGLLLVMNRMVAADSREWPHWVLLMALGGFVGNFIFSLTDHAQNGFFHWTEWIPVVSSAFAVGFLTAPFLTPVTQRFFWALRRAAARSGGGWRAWIRPAHAGQPARVVAEPVGQPRVRRSAAGAVAVSQSRPAGLHQPVGLAIVLARHNW